MSHSPGGISENSGGISESSGGISESGTSLRAALSAAADQLSAAGVACPRVDAELLAAFVLRVPRVRLATVDLFAADQAAEYQRVVGLRARRVPLQHLTGVAPFRHLELSVGRGVFTPRPETELLVEWGLARLGQAPVVVDLCSGTGAIALSVAQECPTATVYAVERDPTAAGWLRRNIAGSAETGRRITAVLGDATAPSVLSELDGQVDLVLCNPPYVPVGTPVPPEVADYDPFVAVFSGPDGLGVIRAVLVRSAALLRGRGWLGVEHSDEHGPAVRELLRAHGGYDHIETHRDLAGRDRFVTARLRCRDDDGTVPSPTAGTGFGRLAG